MTGFEVEVLTFDLDLAPQPAAKPHPAVYSPAILKKLGQELAVESQRIGRPLSVLDPFAGTGRIHDLAGPALRTVGIEIEVEWASYHHRTAVGDARALPFPSNSFDAVVTSPTYANRMADHHEARDGSRRITYRHSLGRPLTPGNSGEMQWGEPYRELHRAAWAEALRVLVPGGLLLVNVKDHVRKGALVPVTDWHREALEALGFVVEAVDHVETPGMRFGANGSTRADHESIIRARAPKSRRATSPKPGTVAGDFPEDVRLYDHERDEAAFAEWAVGVKNFGVDVETTSIDRKLGHGTIWQPGFELRTVQVATTKSAWVFDVGDEASRRVVSTFLSDEGRTFVSHTSFDPMAIAVHLGVDVSRRYVDTWVLAKLVDSAEYEWTGDYKPNRQRTYRRVDSGLKALAARYLKDRTLLEAEADLERWQKEHAPVHHRVGPAFDEWRWKNTPVDLPAFFRYAGLDALNHLRLGYCLRRRIREVGIPDSLVDDERWLEAECLAVTRRGIALDVLVTSARLSQVQSDVDELEAKLREATGVDSPRSPAFASWLQDNGVVFGPGERTETGRGSLNKEVLPGIVARYRDDPMLGPVLVDKARLAGLENKVSNLRQFLAMADLDGRVHPEFKTVQAVTGRMSIVRPALQTLRKGEAELRTCFMADPGKVVVSADFDQVEIRVAAALSGDEALLEVIRSGKSVHDVTARRVFGDDFTPEQRQQSKTANFAILYGAGVPRVAKQLGISESLARQLVQAWRESYPGLVTLSKAAATLSSVVTGSGRRIPVDPDRTYANSNYLIQSTARDLLVEALRRYLSNPAYADSLMIPIHDEIVVQVPREKANEAAAWLEEAMTFDFMGVPITAHVEVYGTHWAGPRDDDRPVGDEGEEGSEKEAAA